MIHNKLLEEIERYCKANNIEDIDAFINKMLRDGFNIEKWGEKPPWFETKEERPEIEPEKVIKVEPDYIKENKEVPEPKSPEPSPEIPEEIVEETPVLEEVPEVSEYPENNPETPEEFPDNEEEIPEKTSKTYNIDIKVKKKEDLYDEDEDYTPRRGFLGSNIFNKRR